MNPPVRHVRDWAPPGWHWVVLPSGQRRLLRVTGPAADPDRLWWYSHGPAAVQREEATTDEILRRIRQEDEHVRRYEWVLEREYSNTWVFSTRVPYHFTYNHVWVPSLWHRCRPRETRRGLGPGRS
jgi:hypothetical protein